MTPILIGISICYLVLILCFISGFNKIPIFKLTDLPPKTRFSIILPFRNEAENLPDILYSLSKLKYPRTHFQILLVNDGSDDPSVEICKKFQVENPELQIQLLENHRRSNSPKKDALLSAIENSKFEYIITTDADCEVPLLWLQSFNEKILESNSKLIAGPVGFQATNSRSLLANFEALDFMSLQATGAASFGIGKAFMCNGANLCYKKSVFLEVDGFTGNDHLSSGDDVFLLQKFQEQKFPVAYLMSPDAEVLTKHQPGLSSLISQRVRWAAKSSAYSSNFAKITGITVLLMNFCLVLGILLSIPGFLSFKVVLLCFMLKFYVDLLMIYKWTDFFKKNNSLIHYSWICFLYPFFTSYVAILSLFIGFEWKGRSFKK